MKFNFKQLTLCALAIFLFSVKTNAQSLFSINETKSTLQITGTSSVHDWEMEAEKMDCKTILKVSNNAVSDIEQISFTLQSEEIKSHNKIMDSKTYKALNTDKFPEIKFVIDSESEFKTNANKSDFTGQLSIAGKTNKVNISCTFVVVSEDVFEVKGEIPLKMSDFNITPPTAMMGALKTGDEVVIKYAFEFNKESQTAK